MLYILVKLFVRTDDYILSINICMIKKLLVKFTNNTKWGFSFEEHISFYRHSLLCSIKKIRNLKICIMTIVIT